MIRSFVPGKWTILAITLRARCQQDQIPRETTGQSITRCLTAQWETRSFSTRSLPKWRTKAGTSRPCLIAKAASIVTTQQMWVVHPYLVLHTKNTSRKLTKSYSTRMNSTRSNWKSSPPGDKVWTRHSEEQDRRWHRASSRPWCLLR